MLNANEAANLSPLSHAGLTAERTRLTDRVEWLYDNLSGCDWCDECGGGNLELAYIGKRTEVIDVLLGHDPRDRP